MRRIFIFDIDSTLYDEKARCFPEDTVEALAQLQTRGHIVVIATGRPPFKARLVNDVGIFPDYYICNNGHCILDKSGNILREERFPAPLAEEITAYCRDHGLGLLWSWKDYVHLYYSAPILEGIRKRTDPKVVFLGPSDAHIRENPLGACLAGTRENVPLFQEHFKESLSFVSINKEYGDLVLKGTSKWEAIKRLSSMLSVRTEDTMAFGDNYNDAEMVMGCGTGVCMGNGTDELKAVADYITSDVDKGGIVHALEHFGIL